MELKEYKNKGQEMTAKTSDICRQLGFAGIGIIWILKSDKIYLDLTHTVLITPLIIITLSLFVDFLHYFIGGIIWLRFYRKKEKEGFLNDSDIKSKSWRSNLMYVLYFFKIGLMFIAYIFVIKALIYFK